MAKAIKPKEDFWLAFDYKTSAEWVLEETVKQIAKTEGLLPDDTVEIKGKDQKYITLDKFGSLSKFNV